MLRTIISVLIANFIFFGAWILYTGFTTIKAVTKLDDNPKGAKARESDRYHYCDYENGCDCD